jgi:hypothetical protein
VHRTVRCATAQCPVHQGTPTPNSPVSGILGATPLKFTGLSGVPAEQRLLHANSRLQTAFNALQCAPESEQRQKAHRTVYRTCPVHHRTVRWPRRQKLQRSNPNGQVTWLAHRTMSGGAPDCPAPCDRQPPNDHFWWLGL